MFQIWDLYCHQLFEASTRVPLSHAPSILLDLFILVAPSTSGGDGVLGFKPPTSRGERPSTKGELTFKPFHL